MSPANNWSVRFGMSAMPLTGKRGATSGSQRLAGASTTLQSRGTIPCARALCQRSWQTSPSILGSSETNWFAGSSCSRSHGPPDGPMSGGVSCRSHVECGVCGPGRAPDAPSDCRQLLRGMGGPFVEFLRGVEGRAACGGRQGADKLAHCWFHCMAGTCGWLWGCAVSLLPDSNDPDDTDANRRESKCALRGGIPGRQGQECLECCGQAVHRFRCY
jgi:hypothetical protein